MNRLLYAVAGLMESTADSVRRIAAWFLLQDPQLDQMALYFFILFVVSVLSASWAGVRRGRGTPRVQSQGHSTFPQSPPPANEWRDGFIAGFFAACEALGQEGREVLVLARD